MRLNAIRMEFITTLSPHTRRSRARRQIVLTGTTGTASKDEARPRYIAIYARILAVSNFGFRRVCGSGNRASRGHSEDLEISHAS